MGNATLWTETFEEGVDPEGWTWTEPASQPAGTFVHDYVTDTRYDASSGLVLRIQQVAAATTSDPATFVSPALSDLSFGPMGGYLWMEFKSETGPVIVELIDDSIGVTIGSQYLYGTYGSWNLVQIFIPSGTYSALRIRISSSVQVGANFTAPTTTEFGLSTIVNKVPDIPAPVSPVLVDLPGREISGPVEGWFDQSFSPSFLTAIGGNDFATDGVAQIVRVAEDGVSSRWVFYDSGVGVDVLHPQVDPTPAPVGSDAFADAPAIGLWQSSAPTDNTNLTTEDGEPDGSGYGGLAKTAWWTFTPAEDGRYAIDLDQTVDLGEDTDTVLCIYTGGPTLADLTLVTYDDDGGNGHWTSKAVFDGTAGTTYYVQAQPTGYSPVNMAYVLRVSEDYGTPIGENAEFPTRIDDNRLAHLWESGSIPAATVISRNLVVTTNGTLPGQPNVDMLTQSSSQTDPGLVWTPANTFGSSGASILMRSDTEGFVVGMADGASGYTGTHNCFLLPVTLSGEVDFAQSPGLFAETAIEMQTSSDRATVTDVYPLSDSVFVAAMRIETLDPNTGYTNLEPRLAVFGFDGQLIAETETLVPISRNVGNTIQQTGYILCSRDPHDPTSFVVASSEQVDDTNDPTNNDWRLYLFRATFDGSTWTVGDKVLIAETGGEDYRPTYPNHVQILGDGRVFLDYTTSLGVGLRPNGVQTWIRHALFLDSNFATLNEWTIGADVDPAVSNYYDIYSRENSVVTDEFAILYYDYGSDYTGQTEQRYLLLRHSEPKVEITVGGHHGTQTIRFTASPAPAQPPSLTPVEEVQRYSGDLATPLAWNGDDKYLFVSGSNNARFFVANIVPGQDPDFGPGRGTSGGFSLTTTSLADYPFVSGFVQDGYAPVIAYSDADSATGPYQLAVLAVGKGTVTLASKVPSPYPNFSSSTQFARGLAVPHHGGEIYLFTNMYSGSYSGEVWHTTVDASGVVAAPTKVGNLTVDAGGDLQARLGNIQSLAMISDRLGFYAKTMVDLQNPTVLLDMATKIPATPNTSIDLMPNGLEAATAQVHPNHIAMVRKSSDSTYWTVVDLLVADDGTSITVDDQWDVPAQANPILSVEVGFVSPGVANAIVKDNANNVVIYRDIFGAAVSFDNGQVYADYQQILPTTSDKGDWAALTVHGNFYLTVQDFLDPIPVPLNVLTVKGPSIPGESSSGPASAALTPGPPTMLQSGSTQGAIVGTGSVLSDGDDATYVTVALTSNRDLAEVQLSPLTGVDPNTVTAMEVHIRAATTDANGGVVHFPVDLSAESGGNGFAGEFGTVEAGDFVEIPRDGEIHDLVIPLLPESEYAIPLSQTATALVPGAFMQIYTSSDTPQPWGVTVYEVSVLVSYTATAAPETSGPMAIDRNEGTISAWFQCGTPAVTVYIQPFARYFTKDSDAPAVEIGSEQLGSILRVDPSANWTERYIYAPAREGATHWLLDLKMFADAAMTQPLPGGTEVYFDCFMVPDNGLDMQAENQPYLDGDQPGAMWEGEDRNSTSIYGTKVAPVFRELVLGDALAIPAPPEIPVPPEEEPTP